MRDSLLVFNDVSNLFTNAKMRFGGLEADLRKEPDTVIAWRSNDN